MHLCKGAVYGCIHNMTCIKASESLRGLPVFTERIDAESKSFSWFVFSFPGGPPVCSLWVCVHSCLPSVSAHSFWPSLSVCTPLCLFWMSTHPYHPSVSEFTLLFSICQWVNIPVFPLWMSTHSCQLPVRLFSTVWELLMLKGPRLPPVVMTCQKTADSLSSTPQRYMESLCIAIHLTFDPNFGLVMILWPLQSWGPCTEEQHHQLSSVTMHSALCKCDYNSSVDLVLPS